MAAFTTVQAGNQADGATFGNTSPGVMGTDYPGLAGDTVTYGHIVTYNMSNANELGQLTFNAGGDLLADKTMDTLLALGHADILITGTGQFTWSDSTARIPAAYTSDITWNPTADNAIGIYVEDGGKLSIFGDPLYYGSDAETALADDPDNTDGDTTIVTKQDMSALWNVGDELTTKVEDAGDSTSHQDAIKLGTIQSMTGTAITLDITIAAATGVGNTWESPVVNVTRNVRLRKVGASTVIGNYNTLRPRIYDLNASGNNNCVLDNVQVTGFHSIDSNYDFRFLDSVIRNCQYGFIYGTNHTISGLVYSNQYGFNGGTNHTVSGSVYSNQHGFNGGSNHTVSGSVYSNQRGFNYSSAFTVSGLVYSNEYGFNYGTTHTVSGSVYSNQHGFNGASNHTVSGSVYSNQRGFTDGGNSTVSGSVYSNERGFNNGSNYKISGALGYDDLGVSSPNTVSDFNVTGFIKMILRGCKLPLAGITFTGRGVGGRAGGIYSEDHGQVPGASVTLHAHGDIIRNTTTLRTGGAPESIEVVPLSSASITDKIPIAKWLEFDVPATAQTRTIYMFGEGWAGMPLATELYIEAEHYGNASDTSKVVVKSTQVLSANDVWEPLSVTFTPAQAGIVRYRAYLGAYNAASKVFVDNQLVKP